MLPQDDCFFSLKEVDSLSELASMAKAKSNVTGKLLQAVWL